LCSERFEEQRDEENILNWGRWSNTNKENTRYEHQRNLCLLDNERGWDG